MVDGATIVRSAVNGRPAITNDPRRLDGVDRRSAAGRLFCDLYDSVEKEFPGADGWRVRQVALLRFELEKARAAGKLTLEDTVRVSHLLERQERALCARAGIVRPPTGRKSAQRKERALRADGRQRPDPPSLQEHLARKAASKALEKPAYRGSEAEG